MNQHISVYTDPDDIRAQFESNFENACSVTAARCDDKVEVTRNDVPIDDVVVPFIRQSRVLDLEFQPLFLSFRRTHFKDGQH
jgi:hypothetical protein